MKHLVLSLLWVCACLAQDIPVSIKKSVLFQDKDDYASLLLSEPAPDGGIIVVRSRKYGLSSNSKGLVFEHYDANLTLKKSTEFDDEKIGDVLGMIVDRNVVHMISQSYSKADKSYVYVARSARISDFEFKSTELFRITSEEIHRGLHLYSDGGSQIYKNANRTHFALSVDVQNSKAETHKLLVFDKSLNKIFEHEFRSDIKDRNFRLQDIEVSEDGAELFLLGKIHAKGAKNESSTGDDQYELTKITGSTEKSIRFDSGDRHINSLWMVSAGKQLGCVGFYSEKNDFRYKGLVYVDLDLSTMTMKPINYNPFTKQFLEDKYGKTKQKELLNLYLRRIMVSPSNEIVLTAEEFYLTFTREMAIKGQNSVQNIYNYNDILCAKLDLSGKLLWVRNINKTQTTYGDPSYVSYSSTMKGDNTYFFINASDRVKKISNNRIEFGQANNASKSNLTVVRINKDGDFDYKTILTGDENEVPFMVSGGVDLEDGLMVFLGRKGKKKQLLKVTIE